MLSRFIACVLCMALPWVAQGQLQTFQLDGTGPSIDVGLNVGVLADSAQSFTLEDALARPFVPSESETISFGPTAADFWLQFNVSNTTDELQRYMLAFNYTLLDSITFYLLQNGEVVSQGIFGEQLPFKTRQVEYRKPTIPLNLAPLEEYTVVLKVHTESSYQLGMRLTAEESFYNKILGEETFYGIIYGIFLVMAAYNLFVFVTLRDWNYVWYAFSIGAVGFFFLCYYGHGFQYLWPEATFFADRSTHFAMGLIAITNPTFARKFLELKRYSKFFNWWCHIGFFLGFAVVILSFTAPYSFNAIWITRIVLLTIPAVLIGGFIAWAKGNKAARFFAIAWLPFLLGGALLMMVNFGTIPSNTITTNGLILGSTLQVTLLSLALGDRYRLIKAKQEQVQRENAKILKEANQTLEQKVRERTLELQESNEELNVTLETIQTQSEDIKKKNDKITDSIRYASLIQNAMLPLDERMQDGFPDNFVFFLPRDIVSGDFYWYQEHSGKHFLAVVDCTGHGVPGALMSMIGANLLNTLVGQKSLTDPGEILTELHHDVERALKQKDTKNRDGMDAALLVWDPKERTLEYSGARNSLLYFKNGEGTEIKADRQSIAGRVIRKKDGSNGDNFHFTTHKLDITEPITCYLYSDGYKDQIGGPSGRKLMHRAFVEMLEDLHSHPMAVQESKMIEHFQLWANDQDQVDDVLVIGVNVG